MLSEHIAWAARDQLIARVEPGRAEDHSAIARRLSRRAHGVDGRRIGASRQKLNRFRIGDLSPGDVAAEVTAVEVSVRKGVGRPRKVT